MSPRHRLAELTDPDAGCTPSCSCHTSLEPHADLAFLADSGYDVAVCAWRALHYPGHTVAVEITPSVHLANLSG